MLDAQLPNEDVEIKGITENSDLVKDGYIFAALHGLKTDGRYYIQKAKENGCILILCDIKDGISGNYIVTDNPRRSYAQMCANLYNNPQRALKTVATTGTNGKTSVTYMLRHIFSSHNKKCGIIGSVECGTGKYMTSSNMTTPDPPALYKILSDIKSDGAEYAFLEASSHSLALDKLSACNFDVGAITNITQDHLDFHKTYENYAYAKSKLFTLCKTGLFNLDDKECVKTAKRAMCEKYFYSAKQKSDFYAENITVQNGSIEFDYFGKGSAHVKMNTPALFNVQNAVCALSASEILGLSVFESAKSLSDFKPPVGRCESLTFEKNQKFSVIIDFSHTPDSLENILKTARTIAKTNRIILVFGCGGNRDKSKRPQMGQIACRYADFSVITSDNSRDEEPMSIIDDIMAGVDKYGKYKIIPDRKEAIIYALESAKEGDVIILAGKGHEEYEITKDGKKNFSERTIVKEWFLNKN